MVNGGIELIVSVVYGEKYVSLPAHYGEYYHTSHHHHHHNLVRHLYAALRWVFFGLVNGLN